MKKVFAILISAVIAYVVVMSASYYSAKMATRNVADAVFFMGGSTGWGSGVHIGDGLVSTANHVAVIDKLSYKDHLAVVLKADPENDTALLSVSGLLSARVPSVKVNCTTHPHVGDEVTVVGVTKEFGKLVMRGPVIKDVGIPGDVGTPEKKGELPREPATATVPATFLVQVPIIPGMSGGGVFDDNGKLIGINVGVATIATGFSVVPIGVAFIVPTDALCKMIK